MTSEDGPVDRPWEQEFVAFVAARGRALRTTAYLLCGDWHQADDLTQTTLTKLYLAWRRIDVDGGVDGYARRTLVRSFVDERRRGWWRRERVTEAVPDRADRGDGPDDRLVLWESLAALPRMQRAAVVLRYWEDLSVAETAAALGVSEGSVKSASLRGLRALREALRESELTIGEERRHAG